MGLPIRRAWDAGSARVADTDLQAVAMLVEQAGRPGDRVDALLQLLARITGQVTRIRQALACLRGVASMHDAKTHLAPLAARRGVPEDP